MFLVRNCVRRLDKELLISSISFKTPLKQKSIVFSLNRNMSALTSNFKNAAEKLKTLKNDPGNETKLKLYALFKQSTEGPCLSNKPTSAFDFVGKAKWSAWKALGEMSQDDAKSEYISVVNNLCNQGNEVKSNIVSGKQFEGITYEVDEYTTQITFARPNKKNAITVQMYKDIASAMKDAGENDTAITVLTGQGDYYSSGNDLSNFSSVEGDLAVAAKNGSELLKEFVAAFIDFPKILVAAVNGPAVGIPVTLLGLCDIVYASEKATFYTPFSLLGQSPEGCATYTYPKIMGYSKANEILLFNKKLTAVEAKEVGLVSKVFPHDNFLQHVKEELSFLPSTSKLSMIHSKALIRGVERSMLHQVNKQECERLVERWQSEDCMEAIMKFFQNKAKL